jgi:hypothetical protein
MRRRAAFDSPSPPPLPWPPSLGVSAWRFCPDTWMVIGRDALSVAALENFVFQVTRSVVRAVFALRHVAHASEMRSSIVDIQSSTGVDAAARPKYNGCSLVKSLR